jgi:hypothetical protein
MELHLHVTAKPYDITNVKNALAKSVYSVTERSVSNLFSSGCV